MTIVRWFRSLNPHIKSHRRSNSEDIMTEVLCKNCVQSWYSPKSMPSCLFPQHRLVKNPTKPFGQGTNQKLPGWKFKIKSTEGRSQKGPGPAATLPRGHVRPYPCQGSCATLPTRILWKGQRFLPIPGVMCDPTWPQRKEAYRFLHFSKPPIRFRLLRGARTPLGRPRGVRAPRLRRSLGCGPFLKSQLQCAQHSFSFSTRSRHPWRPQPCPTGVASTCGAVDAAVTSSLCKFQVNRL